MEITNALLTQLSFAEVIITGEKHCPLSFNRHTDRSVHYQELLTLQEYVCRKFLLAPRTQESEKEVKLMILMIEHVQQQFSITAEGEYRHANLIIWTHRKTVGYDSLNDQQKVVLQHFLATQYNALQYILEAFRAFSTDRASRFAWMGKAFQLLELGDALFSYVTPLLPDLSLFHWHQSVFRFFSVTCPHNLHQQLYKIRNRSQPCKFLHELLTNYSEKLSHRL